MDSVKSSDIVQRVNAGRQAAVKAEDLILDQGGQGQVVEQIGEVLPDVGVAIFPEALIVEAVDLGDLAGLVVSAKDGDALRVSDLEGDEEGDRLNRVVASVDIVAYIVVR